MSDQRKGGRPSKLCPAVHRGIVKLIRQGAFPWVAAQASGIAPRTFYRWMAKGEQGDKRYRQFWRDVRKAAAQARARAEVKIRAMDPFKWLRYGPGRERMNEPGWTDRIEQVWPEPDAVRLVCSRADAMAALRLLRAERERAVLGDPSPSPSLSRSRASAG